MVVSIFFSDIKKKIIAGKAFKTGMGVRGHGPREGKRCLSEGRPRDAGKSILSRSPGPCPSVERPGD